uniref:Uncharacterized protein n=1 Tax=Leersia perrieri TaxID=77586 RepID=A0A0D9XRT7_9ORYZ
MALTQTPSHSHDTRGRFCHLESIQARVRGVIFPSFTLPSLPSHLNHSLILSTLHQSKKHQRNTPHTALFLPYFPASRRGLAVTAVAQCREPSPFIRLRRLAVAVAGALRSLSAPASTRRGFRGRVVFRVWSFLSCGRRWK